MATLTELLSTVQRTSELVQFNVFKRGDKLPDGVRTACRDSLEPEGKDVTFAMGFHDSREWLFSGLRGGQPASYEALLQASDLYLLLSRTISQPNRWNPAWYVESAGRLVRLALQSSVPLCSSISAGIRSHGHYKEAVGSLGEELASAYCSLIGGMDVATEVPGGLEAWGLPRGVLDWRQAYVCMLSGRHGVADWMNTSEQRARDILGKELSQLNAKFEWLASQNEQEKGLTPALRCFIDTRLGTDKPTAPCDFILVQTPSDESSIKRDAAGNPLLFRVKDHEWNGIQVLRNSAQAIDAYVAHTLRSPQKRFDFDPYCENV